MYQLQHGRPQPGKPLPAPLQPTLQRQETDGDPWRRSRLQCARAAREHPSQDGYFSLTALRLASPVSKSPPIMLSMLKKSPSTFAMQGDGPSMDQVTWVASPAGWKVNAAKLWPVIG